jgi:hypothetical protein
MFKFKPIHGIAVVAAVVLDLPCSPAGLRSHDGRLKKQKGADEPRPPLVGSFRSQAAYQQPR